MTDPLPSHEAQPLTVDSIVATAPAIPLHGPVAGGLFYELEKQKLEIERLTLVNAGVRQDAAHRHNWGKNLFPVCAGWIVTVAAILVLEGFHVRRFHLEHVRYHFLEGKGDVRDRLRVCYSALEFLIGCLRLFLHLTCP